MTRFFQAFLLAILFAALPGAIAQPPAPLAGHYYLQGGQSEVGSELLLKEDGKFEWALMYGAVDQMARGTWQQAGGLVTLTVAKREEPTFRLFDEDELTLKKQPAAGKWVAIVGVPRRGPVADVEVRFEAKSGRTVDAVSAQNGDAIVDMPPSESWVRAGLRRNGSGAPWQWLALPPVRTEARIAAFAVVNVETLLAAPFERMTLRVGDGGLVIEEGLDGMRGTYAK